MAALLPTGTLVRFLNSIDPRGEMFVQVVDRTRLTVGRDPLNPVAVIDFSAETVVRDTSQSVPVAKAFLDASSADDGDQKTARATGRYWFELCGKRIECRSAKEVLLASLESIEQKSPGTLHKLFLIKKRTKRIVARDPNDLFDQKHLVKNHSARLGNGWWVGTNNSSEEIKNWLGQAVAQGGLVWGRDFRSSL